MSGGTPSGGKADLASGMESTLSRAAQAVNVAALHRVADEWAVYLREYYDVARRNRRWWRQLAVYLGLVRPLATPRPPRQRYEQLHVDAAERALTGKTPGLAFLPDARLLDAEAQGLARATLMSSEIKDNVYPPRMLLLLPRDMAPKLTVWMGLDVLRHPAIGRPMVVVDPGAGADL